MKLIIVFCFIFVSCNLVNGGVVDNVYDRVRNTTRSVKDNVYGFYTSGKEFIFGKEIVKNEEKAIVREQKGFIETIYRKIYKFFDIFGETNETESNGFAKRMYERIKNRVVQFKHFIIPENKSIEEGIENNVVKSDEGGKKKVIDAVSKVFKGKTVNLTTIKNNDILDKWATLINGIELKGKDLTGQVQNAYEKEIELMKTNFKKIQNNLKEFNDGAKIVGDDAKKLSDLTSEAAKKDFEKNKA